MLHSPVRSSQSDALVADFLPLQRFLLPLMIVALLLTSLIAFTRGWQKTVAETGAIDLHPYWYYGHFVRMGVNPYTAFAAQEPLPAAVHYWDGSEVAPDQVRHERLAQIPANTASTLLISALLSYVPWNQIKY